MVFADNLLNLMNESGLNTIELGRILGVSDESISNWKKGKSIPKIDVAMKIADYFGVSLDELLGKPLNTERMIQIPLVGAVNAGFFSIENEEEWKNRFCSVSMRLLQGRNQKECVALEVVGESMSPLLLPGDVLIVHKQETAYNGNIVIAYDSTENGYTVKRFYRQSDTVILDPVNKDYPQMKYTRPSWKELCLYGVCVGLERKLV